MPEKCSAALIGSWGWPDVPHVLLGEARRIRHREGKPAAVIVDIDEYREMLERLEDVEDLRRLEEMRKKPLKFRRLEDFLKEYHRL